MDDFSLMTLGTLGVWSAVAWHQYTVDSNQAYQGWILLSSDECFGDNASPDSHLT